MAFSYAAFISSRLGVRLGVGVLSEGADSERVAGAGAARLRAVLRQLRLEMLQLSPSLQRKAAGDRVVSTTGRRSTAASNLDFAAAAHRYAPG